MRHKTLHFIRHYAEMLIAMSLGMAVLGATSLVFGDNWTSSAPELHLIAMATAMSVPMVAWMRHRGHGWAPAWEMTAAMFAPTVAAIVLLWAGTAGTDALMEIQHVAMFPAMLAVMFLRLDEYTRHPAHA